MNQKTTKRINAYALTDLAKLIGLSNIELDNHILKARAKFMEYEKLNLSEAFPQIVKGADMDSLMLGVILMTFTSDCTFDHYFEGEDNGD